MALPLPILVLGLDVLASDFSLLASIAVAGFISRFFVSFSILAFIRLGIFGLFSGDGSGDGSGDVFGDVFGVLSFLVVLSSPGFLCSSGAG